MEIIDLGKKTLYNRTTTNYYATTKSSEKTMETTVRMLCVLMAVMVVFTGTTESRRHWDRSKFLIQFLFLLV